MPVLADDDGEQEKWGSSYCCGIGKLQREGVLSAKREVPAIVITVGLSSG